MADSPAPDPFAAPPAAETAPIGRNRQFRLLWTCMLVIGAGNSMLLAVAPVTGTPWLLAIAIDSGEALHAISTVLQASPGAGVVLLLVV